MGITFSTKLSPSAHLDNLVKKARTSTGTLCQKLNPQKIPFQSATRLLNGVVVPSGTYGLDIYEMNEIRRNEHPQKLENHFWKVWCGVSQHHSSRNSRHHLLEYDFLNLQGAKGIRRRIITLFHCSGLHSCICIFDNCFRIQNTECCDSILGFSVGEACRCRLCDSQLRDNYQLLHCKNLCGTPFQRVKAVFWMISDALAS